MACQPDKTAVMWVGYGQGWLVQQLTQQAVHAADGTVGYLL